jgi:hypothetical protein
MNASTGMDSWLAEVHVFVKSPSRLEIANSPGARQSPACRQERPPWAARCLHVDGSSLCF